MNIIEKRELRNELKYKDTVILTYNIKYPVITFSNYDIGKTSFNQYNLEKAKKLEHIVVTELYEDAKKVYDYNMSNNIPFFSYELVYNYNVTYNKKPIISLYSDQYIYSGGAHGSTIRTSQTWNLNTGMQITLSSLFNNNCSYVILILKEILHQIETQIENGTGFYFEDYAKLVVENFNFDQFYLDNNNIAIYYQQYDIAPYSSGIPVFLIYMENLFN